MATIKQEFGLDPEQALDYFRAKGLKPTFHWLDLFRTEHEAAFTVAKLMDLELLASVRAAVDRALAEGKTAKWFDDHLTPTLVEAGWWGTKKQTDPLTGEVITAQLGSPWRLRNIFRTNLQQSYTAGKWERIENTKQAFPYLRYNAIDDHRTRPEHARWDGLILPVDDPFWSTHYPPNGFACRCDAIPMSAKRAEAAGVSTPPAPELVDWTNPRTGKTYQIDTGIDGGWDYHPGKARYEKLAALFAERLKTKAAQAAAAKHAAAAAARTAAKAQALEAAAAAEARAQAAQATQAWQRAERAEEAAQATLDHIAAHPQGQKLKTKALAELTKAGTADTLSPSELLAAVEAQAAAAQAKASASAALSGYKKKVLAGADPTPAQIKALDSLTPAARRAWLAKLEAEVGGEAAKSAERAAAAERARIKATQAKAQIAAEAEAAQAKQQGQAAGDAALLDPEGEVAWGVDGPAPNEPSAMTVNGVAFEDGYLPPITDEDGELDWKTIPGQHENLAGDGPLELPGKKKPAAGVIVVEPDGRVWIVEPKGHYGGVEHTYPKGHQDPGEGLDLQQTALKELFEEAGLEAEILDVLGDYEKTQTMSRYYVARRTGGAPWEAIGGESQAVKLVPSYKLDGYVNKAADKQIAKDLESYLAVAAHHGDGDILTGIKMAQAQKKALASTDTELTKLVTGQGATPALKTKIAKELVAANEQYKAAAPWDVMTSAEIVAQVETEYANAKAAHALKQTLNAAAKKLAAGKPLTAKQVDAVEGLAGGALDAFTAQIDALQAGTTAAQAGRTAAKASARADSATEAAETAAQTARIAASDTTELSPGQIPLGDAENILATQLAGPGGSNDGGIFQGADGVKRYVKFYPETTQSYVEAITNTTYRRLGLGAGESELFAHDGRLAIATRLIDNQGELGKLKLTGAMADDALDGFAADVWLANWDAAGLAGDNMVLGIDGKVIRIDNGGALLYRAQAGRKPEAALGELSELAGFLNPSLNPAYARLFDAAKVTDHQALGARFVDQVDAILALGADTANFADLVPALPGLDPTDRDQILATLRARAALLGAERDRIAAALKLSAPKPKPAPKPKALLPDATRKQILAARGNGVSVPSDAGDIEDQEILMWTETGADGRARTGATFKLLPQRAKDLYAKIGGAQAAAANQIDFTELHAQMIEALKGVASNPKVRAKDLERVQKLRVAYAAKRKEILAAVNAKQITRAQLTAWSAHYGPWLKQLDAAVAPGLDGIMNWSIPAGGPKQLSPAHPVRLKPLPGTEPEAGQALWRHQAGRHEAKRNEHGHLTQTGDTVDYYRVGTDAWQSYRETTVDGITIRFWPDVEGIAIAQRGKVEILAPGTDAGAMERALASVREHLGVDPRPPTPADLEERYLRQLAFARGLELAPSDPDQNQRLAKLVNALTVDLDGTDPRTLPGYDPTPQVTDLYGNARAVVLRPDLDTPEGKAYMKARRLRHIAGDNGIVAMFKSIMTEGGYWHAKADFFRRGKDFSEYGMSPVEDMELGGGNYVYTKVKPAKTPAKFVGLTWNANPLRRLDMKVHKYDPVGKIERRLQRTNKAASMADFERWDDTYEAIFKNGLSFFADDFKVHTDNAKERKALIAWVKELGDPYNKGIWPDGRKLEDVIR